MPPRVRPSVGQLLDSMTNTAAFVRNGHLDILAANQLGYALYSPVFDSRVSGDPRRPANLARFIFLDDQSAQFYRDWDGIAHQRAWAAARAWPSSSNGSAERSTYSPRKRRPSTAAAAGTAGRRHYRGRQ